MLTVTLIIGVLVALLLIEITGITAGAIIAPGYVALLLDQPKALVGVAAAVIGTHVSVSLLAPWLSLYGTRRLTISILIGMVLATGIGHLGSGFWSDAFIWAGLGYVVPGLIAHQWYRQGLLPTFLTLAIAASITRLLALMTMAVLQ